MKFCRLVKYDFINGIWGNIKYYLVLALICIIFFLDYYYKVMFGMQALDSNEEVTIINFLFYFFCGKEVFTPTIESVFIFPTIWFLIFLLAAYFTLDYPFQNLIEQGTQVFLRSGSRGMWWLSKCYWVGFSTLLYFLVFYITILVLCIFFHISISIGFSKNINIITMGLDFKNSVNSRQIIMLIFVLPLMTALAVNYIQLCLGLFVKKIYAFLGSALILFVSAYLQTWIAIGNYAMIKRSRFYDADGVTFKQGIAVNSFIIITVIIIGYLRIGKLDILKKDEGEMS